MINHIFISFSTVQIYELSYIHLHASVILKRNETRLEGNETRLERNETHLARNDTRGGNLHLSGTVCYSSFIHALYAFIEFCTG